MGTPCAIGMKMEDGSVRAIRCNYDGYVAGAGVILGGWYTDAAKFEALLALGELSRLAEALTDCVAYHRDRHEPMRPAKLFAGIVVKKDTIENPSLILDSCLIFKGKDVYYIK